MAEESKIKIYKGEPTAGQGDGTLITDLSPLDTGRIRVPIEGYTMGEWLKLAVRCDDGFQTVEDEQTTIEIADGDHIDKWQLAPDDGYGEPDEENAEAWGDPLLIAELIGDTNTIFWARARAAYTEEAHKDGSVSIEATATVEEA